jgi:hypothetical protein
MESLPNTSASSSSNEDLLNKHDISTEEQPSQSSFSLLPMASKKISKKAMNKSRLQALKASNDFTKSEYKLIFDPFKFISPFSTYFSMT